MRGIVRPLILDIIDIKCLYRVVESTYVGTPEYQSRDFSPSRIPIFLLGFWIFRIFQIPINHFLFFRIIQTFSNAEADTMFTVHHLENSQSFRIVWLLEELGLDYNIMIYNRLPDRLAPDDFKAISQTGNSPTITDGTFTLCESNAIIEYVQDKAGDHRMRPSFGSEDRIHCFMQHKDRSCHLP